MGSLLRVSLKDVAEPSEDECSKPGRCHLEGEGRHGLTSNAIWCSVVCFPRCQETRMLIECTLTDEMQEDTAAYGASASTRGTT